MLFLVSCSKDSEKPTEKYLSPTDSISYYLKKIESSDIKNIDKVKILDKATTIVKNSENSLKTRELNFDIISKYFETQEWSHYKNAAEILLKNSMSAKDVISLAKSYRSFGNYYYQIKQHDSSFYFYTKAEKIYYQINDYDGYSTIMLKKGLIQFNANDNLGADLSLSKSLGVLKKINDSKKKYSVLIQLGLNSNQLKEYSKAINYFNDALNIAKENNYSDNFQESVCLSNIGLVYQNLKDHKKAISFFNKSLKDNNLKQDYPEAYSNIIDNLAYSKLQINDFKGLSNLFIESLKIRENLNDNSAIITSYIHLSEYYDKIKQKKEALKYANLALEVAKREKTPIDLLFSLKQASVVDNKNAAKYSEDYLRISDSLQIAERNSKDRFARIQLGTQEIIQENDVLEDRNRNLLYVFIFTVILASLLFIVRAQRTRTRELLYKQTQQKANEEIFNLMMSQQAIIDESRSKEKKRLARDLHDGVLGRMFGLRMNLDSLNN
ncbi:tetratricopeptide repeat protein, partial [Flavobacterium sp.]|uniref:tetratricopeptide repeat protein n=1 Tax=Flavobacterium sp. TaxID=239 RepID=UPI003918A2EC